MSLVLMSVAGAAVTATPAWATTGINDYPSSLAIASQDSIVDPWGFYNRECVSFVAWRLNNDNGLAFSNNMRGGHFGNAYQWKQNAINLFGASVFNGSPAVGSVAWWDSNHGFAGAMGHVAYVNSVNTNGSINIEEYNYSGTGAYHTRTIAMTGDWPSGFLHMKDLSAPLPPSQWNGVGNAMFLGSNRLTNGQQMHSNQYIMSDDGRFVLLLQSDGNLVEYTASGAVWSTGTSGYPGAWLGVQSDGNVVLYTSTNVPLWYTGAHAIYAFTLQNDANLVGYTLSGQPMWATGVTRSTAGMSYKAEALYNGMTMTQGQYLRSTDRRYFSLVQGDGNLVVYAPGYRVVWNSGTSGYPGAWLGVQSDGNMVMYSALNVALWSTGAIGVNSAVMQSDGNFAAYNSSGTAVWATYTVGQL